MSEVENGYRFGLIDAIEVCQRARSEGETDMRQVINWIRELIPKEEKEGE